MENKSNVIIILLVVLIGAVAGGDLLTGIDNAVRASLSPMYAKIAEIDRTEKSIENKLNASGNGNSSAFFAAIQNELSQIQNRINSLYFSPDNSLPLSSIVLLIDLTNCPPSGFNT